MHPSFGVPWPRLQRAAARLEQLHAAQPERARVHALIFLCGLKYLFTYRNATGRRLSHYLDDGLREAVEHTLPALMKRAAMFQPRLAQHRRSTASVTEHDGFERLLFAFEKLHARLPAATARWIQQCGGDDNLVRLSFGMGVVARFAPESHEFIRQLLDKPLLLSSPVVDVLESFQWDPEWSVVLAR